MEVLKITHENVIKEVEKHIKNGLTGTIYLNVNTPMAFISGDNLVDKEACENNGYTTYAAHYNGGAVILNEGDFVFAQFLRRPYVESPKRFIDYFINWLKNKNINAEFVKNDILVDGHKISGMGTKFYGKLCYFVCFININSNLDHIKAICNKPMVKIPKGLNEYGITTEEIEQMFLDFCKQDKENHKY